MTVKTEQLVAATEPLPSGAQLEHAWQGESQWTIDTLRVIGLERGKLWHVPSLYKEGYNGEHESIHLRLLLGRFVALEDTIPVEKREAAQELIQAGDPALWVRVGASREYRSQPESISTILKLSGLEMALNAEGEQQLTPILTDRQSNKVSYIGPLGLYMQARS